MSVDSHIHIRHIILYHFEKGWMAAQPFRHINELFGEGTISQSQVERWFKEINKKGRGWKSDFDDDALLETMKEDKSLTTRMLVEQVDADHYIILRRLNPKFQYASRF